MSKASRILKIVEDRDELRHKVERLEDDLKREEALVQEILEFGQSIDPEFRKKCLKAHDAKRNKTWDWQSIVGNTKFQTSQQRRIDPDYKPLEYNTFEYTPYPKEDDDENTP